MHQEIQNALALSIEHLKKSRFAEAESVLDVAIARFPDSTDLLARKGLLLTVTQREFEAAKLLDSAKGGEDFDKFAQNLVDYAFCRAQTAEKLGEADREGAELSKALQKKLPDFKPGKVGIKVSACLIVRNEEANLPRCLKSLKGLVDEIIVIDTGSTDKTVAIAESFGAKIGNFPWCEDFAAARNASLELATGDWALWIDADEEIEQGGEKMLREALMRPYFGGFTVQIVNFLGDPTTGGRYVHAAVRLFRRIPGILFAGRIHEQIIPALFQQGFPTANLDKFRLLHYGYAPGAMQEKGKLDRTITMLEREVAQYPNDPFHLFNLANVYVVAGREQDAKAPIEKSIEQMGNDAPYAEVAYHLLSSIRLSLGDAEGALKACDEASASGWNSIVNEFDRANALTHLGMHGQALEVLDRSDDMVWPARLIGDYGIKTYKRWILRGQILGRMGELEMAIQAFDRALESDPDFKITKHSKGVVLSAMGRHSDAVTLFLQCTEDSQIGDDALRGLAKSMVALKNFEGSHAAALELWNRGYHDEDVFIIRVRSAEEMTDGNKILAAYEDYAANEELTAPILINWGRSLLESGDSNRALQCFTEAIKRDPNDPNSYFNAGDLLYTLGNYADAAHLYQAALRMMPTFAGGWFVLGNALFQMGILDGAETAYQQAIQNSPGHTGAMANLATLHEERRQLAS